MSITTPFAIARCWAAAFAADRLLADWAQRNYGKPFAIQIGTDMRRPPDADDAPFIVIFPDASKTGPQRQSVTSNLGLVAGIADAEMPEENGVVTMRGLVRLNELCPLLEKVMRDALRRATPQEVDTEYDILQYPLCMALMTITVEESLPTGRRLGG